MLAVASAALLLAASPYRRVQSINASSFLDTVDFFTANDPTHGSVTFVNKTEAIAEGLVRFDNGQIFMSADMKSEGTPRKSVRVYSKRTFTRGLFVIDVEHVPTGCGTWPAFWLCGPSWPHGGEIDILESVHRWTHDATTLHTSRKCSMAGVDKSTFTGHRTTEDCDVHDPLQPANAGCSIRDDAVSIGAPFNARKGGVIATVWDYWGVRAYSWHRGQVPDDVSARWAPDEARWGKPYARFDFGSACDASHFRDHQMIFDLTLCGGWAGPTFSKECPQTGGSCEDFVGAAKNMQEASWLVNYVDVYEDWLHPSGVGRSQGYQGPPERYRVSDPS